MPKELKKYSCLVCGKEYVARERNYRHTCSVDCAVKRVREALDSISKREGEAYERWRAGYQRGFSKWRRYVEYQQRAMKE